MKLRNKKTGLIIDSNEWSIESGYLYITISNDNDSTISYKYESLAELNEEWEDYVPKEPLIKDEKICKAVRAWAEALDVDEVSYNSCAEYSEGRFEAKMGVADIDFGQVIELKDDNYTIAELCGEEK